MLVFLLAGGFACASAEAIIKAKPQRAAIADAGDRANPIVARAGAGRPLAWIAVGNERICGHHLADAIPSA